VSCATAAPATTQNETKEHDMPSQTSSRGLHAPTDVSADYDPFLATHPTVLVHDADLETLERAWHDSDAQCPQCHYGTADQRGTSPANQRRWVRFTCGDVIAQEQTAG
jgi:hypothetical protein